jgi:hypothetical protein
MHMHERFAAPEPMPIGEETALRPPLAAIDASSPRSVDEALDRLLCYAAAAA